MFFVSGTVARDLVNDTSTQVEVIATAHPCPLCEGPLHLEAHDVEPVVGVLLRVARLVCTRCRVRRQRWFRLEERRLN